MITDNTPLTIGLKHSCVPMGKVPREYLRYLYDRNYLFGEWKEYVKHKLNLK